MVRDGRLKKNIHYEWNGNQVHIRAPRHIPERQLDEHVAEIVKKIKGKRARVRARADEELEAIAHKINKKYFGGEVEWHSIRWVSNMRKRLGSCTSGGPTDGDIRVSDRIKGWPSWVVEYVIAHELAHRQHPNHSKEFWAYVSRYPKTERARGFVMGMAYQLGEDAEDWL
jgi:predicted metal-dependent hydrolase